MEVSHRFSAGYPWVTYPCATGAVYAGNGAQVRATMVVSIHSVGTPEALYTPKLCIRCGH
jgi:hypothetical protein